MMAGAIPGSDRSGQELIDDSAVVSASLCRSDIDTDFIGSVSVSVLIVVAVDL